MRALLSAVGTRGDVQPAVALALELRKRGHGVRMCISPNFVDWAKSLGLDARPGVRSTGLALSLPPNLLQVTDNFMVEGQVLPPNQSAPVGPVVMVNPAFFRTLGVPILSGDEWDSTMSVEGHTAADGEDMQAFMNSLSPGYFQTMQIPLLEGREFLRQEAGRLGLCVRGGVGHHEEVVEEHGRRLRRRVGRKRDCGGVMPSFRHARLHVNEASGAWRAPLRARCDAAGARQGPRRTARQVSRS